MRALLCYAIATGLICSCSNAQFRTGGAPPVHAASQDGGVTADASVITDPGSSTIAEEGSGIAGASEPSETDDASIDESQETIPAAPKLECDGKFTSLASLAPEQFSEISTIQQLRAMKSGGLYRLTQSIDLNDPWTPLAKLERIILDGGGFALSGLRIANRDVAESGLFSSLDCSQIRNLRITVTEVAGTDDVGALAGRIANGSRLENISIEGGSITGHANVGGVVGTANRSIIVGSRSETTVQTPSTCAKSGSCFYNIGGIAGLVENPNGVEGPHVRNSTFTGSIAGSPDQSSYVGGIAGQMLGKMLGAQSKARVRGGLWVGGLVGVSPSIEILESSSESMVTGYQFVGGIAGAMSGSAQNSFSDSILASQSDQASALANPFGFNLKLINCYAIGSGYSRMVGNIAATQLTNSYWLKPANYDPSKYDPKESGAARDLVELKDQGSFINWDFVQVWRLDASQTPRLRRN
jgi:hypothetical protein